MSKEKVFVTGAGGFIGSELAAKLSSGKYEVEALERNKTDSKSSNRDANYLVHYADLTDYAAIRRIVKESQPDYMVHLAALVGPTSFSYDNYIDVTETDYVATINLAEACHREVPHFKQFIFAGSPQEYGSSFKDPEKKLTEKSELNPNNLYAVSKVASGFYLKYMYNTYKFPYTILRPYNCYDDKTEILTDGGWKLFKNLDKSERVATLNPKTNNLEFQKPIEYITSDYNGKIVHINGKQIDIAVTPNHRMWVRKNWKKNYEIMKASELLKLNNKRAVEFQLSAEWQGEVNLPRRWYDLNWIKFLAWWLSEGTLERRPNHHTIDLRQTSSEENLEEIYQVSKNLGFNAHKYPAQMVQFTDSVRIDKNGVYGNYTADGELYSYLKQFGKSRDKYVPREIKQLPKELIRLFLDTYQKGDGSRGGFGINNDGYMYSDVRDCIISSSSRLLNDLQELCVKAGYASSVNGRFLTIARERTTVTPRTSRNFVQQDYKGKVYCVSVPNEILYVRRNGKAVFCGNTYGRKNNTNFFIEHAISQMLTQDKIYLGDPDAVRDWLYVDDHVDGYVRTIGNTKALGESIQLCTGKGYSTKETAELIARLVDFKGQIVWNVTKKRPLDSSMVIGDNSKAKRLLGWKPRVTLKEGLKRTIAYYKNLYRKGLAPVREDLD